MHSDDAIKKVLIDVMVALHLKEKAVEERCVSTATTMIIDRFSGHSSYFLDRQSEAPSVVLVDHA